MTISCPPTARWARLSSRPNRPIPKSASAKLRSRPFGADLPARRRQPLRRVRPAPLSCRRRWPCPVPDRHAGGWTGLARQAEPGWKHHRRAPEGGCRRGVTAYPIRAFSAARAQISCFRNLLALLRCPPAPDNRRPTPYTISRSIPGTTVPATASLGRHAERSRSERSPWMCPSDRHEMR
jgi:hypothetical protein